MQNFALTFDTEAQAIAALPEYRSQELSMVERNANGLQLELPLIASRKAA